MNSWVRHVAGCRSPIIAVGAFEKDVQIWNVEAGSRISAFRTGFDFGGKRLALSALGDKLYAGAYHKHGIAAYSTIGGELLWQRKDVSKIQHVAISHDDQRIYCSLQDSGAVILSAVDGTTIDRIAEAKNVFCSQIDDAFVVEGEEIAFLSESELFSIQPESFGVLDCAFGDETICISEAGAQIRLFSRRNGSEVWRVTPDNQRGIGRLLKGASHYLTVSFLRSQSCFYGVLWNFDRGGPKRLVRVQEHMPPQVVAKIGETAVHEFCCGGECLIDWGGRVWDVASGKVLKQLAFGI